MNRCVGSVGSVMVRNFQVTVVERGERERIKGMERTCRLILNGAIFRDLTFVFECIDLVVH